jgi:ABC-type multidrug transport system fused ATPase/permease subunit
LLQIVVLEEGRVVERGSHEVLLSMNGRYAQLWNQQNNTDGGSDVDKLNAAM